GAADRAAAGAGDARRARRTRWNVAADGHVRAAVRGRARGAARRGVRVRADLGMSFHSPAFLVLLAIVPVGLVVQLVLERRGRASFASKPLMPAVAPRRPRWRRQVPLLFQALAVSGLIVALARPQTTEAVPVEQATVVVATDRSGSMQATDVAPTRLAAARR